MTKLNRTLELKDAISIVAGSMIGSGIFIVSTDIMRQVNSAIIMLIVWLIAGYTTLCGALSYGELSSTIEDEGGQYIYLKKIFSEKIAFVYGWTLFTVIQTGTLAAVNIAFAKFIGLIFPVISENNILFSILNWNFTTQQLFALITVIILTYINSRGIKSGITVQHIFTITKVLSMAGIIVCGLLFGLNFDVISSNFSLQNNIIHFDFSLLTMIAVAIVGAMFTSITWNNVTFIASEIKKPEKNIPKALMIGTLLVISLYLLINLIYLGSMPIDLIKNSPEDIVAAGLMGEIFAQKGLITIAIIIAISAFGCANGMILTGSRVYYKMAKDKLFFRSLAKINRKTKVPVNSLWFQCAWICLLILWGSYFKLLDFVIYVSLIFYAVTIYGIFIMRKKFPQNKDVFKVPNFIPISFLVISIFVVAALSFYKPATTLPGLLILLMGFPVYKRWDRKRKGLSF